MPSELHKDLQNAFRDEGSTFMDEFHKWLTSEAVKRGIKPHYPQKWRRRVFQNAFSIGTGLYRRKSFSETLSHDKVNLLSSSVSLETYGDNPVSPHNGPEEHTKEYKKEISLPKT